MKNPLMFSLLLLAACASKPVLEKDEQITALLGTWEGNIKQPKQPPQFTRIVFKEDQGTLVGKMTVVTSKCVTDMKAIARGDHTFEFFHTLAQGNSDCTDGRDDIILIDDDTLRITFIHEDGITSDTGILKKVAH